MKKRKIAALLTFAIIMAPFSVHAEETEKHLNLGLTWFATTLDPADESVDYNSWMLSRMDVGENLFTVDENMVLQNQLADSWENVDENTWKIHVRDGVTFHNGNPVTAEAVMNSINRVIADNVRGQNLVNIDHMEADGQDLTIVTKEPNGALLAGLSEPLFMIVDTTADVDNFVNQPVLTGPYKVDSFEKDNVVELEAYDGYWGGTPGFDTITVKNVTDSEAGVMALQNEELDILTVPSTSLSVLEDAGFQTMTVEGIREYFGIFNMSQERFQNSDLREAISYAINRDGMASLIGSDCSVAAAPFPSSVPFGYDQLEKQSYDEEKAKELLKAAGYEDTDGDGVVEDADGEPLKMTISVAYDLAGSGEMIDTIAASMQSGLQAVGIDCSIANLENGSAIKENHEYDLAICNFLSAITGDPYSFLRANWGTDGGTNYTGYSNAEFDEVLAKLSAATDPQERYSIAQEAQQILLNDNASVFMVTKNYNIAASSKIKNLKGFPLDYYLLTPDTTME